MLTELSSARSCVARTALAAVALIVCLRALVPIGFMIDRDPENGSFTVRVCPSQTQGYTHLIDVGVFEDLHAHHSDRLSKSDLDFLEQCPFEAVAKSVVNASPSFMLVSLGFSPIQFQFPALAGDLRSFASPPLPPRGPPVLH